MITSYPAPASCGEKHDPTSHLLPPRPVAIPSPGSWRYNSGGRSRGQFALAMAISIAVHGAIVAGSLIARNRPKPVKHVVEAPVIRLAIPEMKDLEPPEVVADDTAPPVTDLAVPVPMQADLPSLPRPNDFVQPLNFSSLLEQPDLSQAKLTVIPDQYIRGTRIADSIGKIFDLADLDRHPEPVLQPAPAYPHSLRRDGLSATVLVEFIVTVDGRVVEPIIAGTTHDGFNDAAITGVNRWKFRAGVKGGRKVNVRMRVPIVFKVLDGDIE